MIDIVGERLVEAQSLGLYQPEPPVPVDGGRVRCVPGRLARWYREQTGLNPWTAQAQEEIRAIAGQLREWGLVEEEARVETNCDPRWNRRPERSFRERRAVLVGKDENPRLHRGDACRWLVPGK